MADTLNSLAMSVEGLKTGYSTQPVIEDLSLTIKRGEVVCLIGHNGAGKTTLLNSIFGLQPVWEGTVTFNHQQIQREALDAKIRRGIMLVPQNRCNIAGLTVRENLELATYALNVKQKDTRQLEYVFELFPILKEKHASQAGLLSGGQQQMLSIGMGLMTKPKLLLLDEPSVGLAPAVVEEVMNAVKRIHNEEGISILMVEQNLKAALRIATRALVMRTGQIIMDTEPEDILNKEENELWQLF